MNQFDHIHIDSDGLVHICGSVAGNFYTTLCATNVRDETVEWVYKVNKQPTTCLRCVANHLKIKRMGNLHG